MNSLQAKKIRLSNEKITSKAGYSFNLDDKYWRLDNNTNIPVDAVVSLLDVELSENYTKVLAYYASSYSSSHVDNINSRFLNFIRITDTSLAITESALINYRSNISRSNEWYLGTLRGFFKKWHDLGYDGVTHEIIELLNGWTLKGNVKGDVIKRLDPIRGPLSDFELQGFNEGVVQAFERDDVSLTSMAIALVISNTGRRPIQISHLRLKDILIGQNNKGETIHLLNVPRAKQRAAKFRGEFSQFAITQELWMILTAQSKYVEQLSKNKFEFKLAKSDKLELPLFPVWNIVKNIKSLQQLRDLNKIDKLHIPSATITNTCKKTAKAAKIYSERTGDILNITSTRFRYTIGTRAAREGFGDMVIAELLDHSDNQNSSVYIENIPEHVENLDKAVGHQMARYAQAFSGVLVNDESEAKRGNDLNSRIKTNGDNIGTCGSHGFCGANVPIPCYTCIHFQPWLDGPHEVVYKELVKERKRLFDITNDMQITSVNDRSILAVINVIQQCAQRREELQND